MRCHIDLPVKGVMTDTWRALRQFWQLLAPILFVSRSVGALETYAIRTGSRLLPCQVFRLTQRIKAADPSDIIERLLPQPWHARSW